MTKSNLKNSYDVNLVTSSPLHHRKTPPKINHKFPIPPIPHQKFWLRQWSIQCIV